MKLLGNVCAAIGVVALVVIAAGLFGGGRETVNDYAWIAAERAVETRLKAPKTAKFDRPPSILFYDGFANVTGVVHAQNSFGALVRSDYSVRLRATCTEKNSGCWQPETITIKTQ